MANYEIGISLVASDSASAEIATVESNLTQLDEMQSNAATSANQMSDAAQKNKSAFGDLQSSITGLLTGYASLKGIQMVGEMIDQGNAVNLASSTFRNLTGGVEEASTALGEMRAATGGIVSDYDLMNGANRLLLMGIAQTGEQAASLTQIAVTLGHAMGEDAGQSIADFASLLSNQSIPRLDNFGISSDRVRQRLVELKAAGIGAQEAFSMAVMEQGQSALEKLGTATQDQITYVDKLKTAWGNFFDDFQSRLATSVNALLGMATLPTEQQPDWMKTIEDIAATLNPTIGTYKALQDQANAAAQAEADANQAAQMQSRFSAPSPLGDMATQYKADLAGIRDAMTEGMNTPIPVNPLAGIFGINRATSDAFDAMGAQMDEAAQVNTMIYWGSYTQYWRSQQQDWQEQASQEAGQAVRDIMSAQGTLSDFMQQAGSVGGLAMQETADEIATKFQEIQALGDQGLISQADVDKAKQLADQSQQAADNLKNMSLTTAFGQGTGGMMGQMSDQVIDAMRKAGKSDKEIEAAQRAFDMASGRQTSASTTFTDIIVPELAKMSPEDAAKAMENITTFLEKAKTMQLTPGQTAGLLPQATGFTGGAGQAFTVNPGDTLSAISARTGIPVDQLLAATGASSSRTVQPGTYNLGGYSAVPGFDVNTLFMGAGQVPGAGGEAAGRDPASILQTKLADMVPDSETLRDNFSQLSDHVVTVSDNVSIVKDNMEALTKGVHTVSVDVQFQNIEKVQALLDAMGVSYTPTTGAGAGAGTTKTKDANRDHGGQPPGIDDRTGPS